MSREKMHFDVIIIGAGPAGLTAAIRLKQHCQANNKDLSICVLEKGRYVGAHTLSGAVLEPTALHELFPEGLPAGAPLTQAVKKDRFYYLTHKLAVRLPTPPQMRNRGNAIIRLGDFCAWLADIATQMGIEIYPGFAASEILYDQHNTVIGVATNDKGIKKNGEHSESYQSGIELLAKQTIFAEGCRGSLTQQLLAKFQLTQDSQPQTYGLGVKEFWEVDSKYYQPGTVWHSVGWPLDNRTYGGSFIYHLDQNHVALGLVVGLDYENPYLNPYEELQRFKCHPKVKPLLQGGQRLMYGARALNEGGIQSIPKLTFPGGMIVGCGAGFMNVPKIKGIHTAMKSALTAADALFSHLDSQTVVHECVAYGEQIKHTWLWPELSRVRNIRPGFKHGLGVGLLNAAAETYVWRGHAPWTLSTPADYLQLKRAVDCLPIDYPKHDGVLTFDKLTSVQATQISQAEDQPCHLHLKDPALAISVNYQEYASPETRYCPASVYEIVMQANNTPRFQINTANCIHCKACDIKDPTQNIVWTPPQGGDGPQYMGM